MSTWNKLTSINIFSPPNGMCSGNGLYIVVGNGNIGGDGDAETCVYTSNDKITWTKRLTTTKMLFGAEFLNNMFFVCGDGGILYSSSDGITWTQLTSNITTQLWGIAYGNGKYIGVSSDGDIIISTDGINWTSQPRPFGLRYYRIIFVNGLFLVASNDGLIISENGSDWLRSINTGSNFITSINYGNGMFVCGGANLYTSTDAIHWIERIHNIDNSSGGEPR